MIEFTTKFTYNELRYRLDREGAVAMGPEGKTHTLALSDTVSIHDHPDSGRHREIHVMADGVKVAEIGPATGGETEDVAPGYVDLLAEWQGKPVSHNDLKDRILADNGLDTTDAVLEALAVDLRLALDDSTNLYAVLQRAAAVADAILGPRPLPSYELAVASARVRFTPEKGSDE